MWIFSDLSVLCAEKQVNCGLFCEGVGQSLAKTHIEIQWQFS